MPKEENSFFELMDVYFVNYYDIKEIKRDNDYLYGGLNKISKDLGITRIGTNHQAGSDALVTCGVFFRLLKCMAYQWTQISIKDPLKHFNRLVYGLGSSHNDDRYLEEYKHIVVDNGKN